MSLIKKAVAAGTIFAPLTGKFNDDYNECDELKYGPLTLWRRDEKGNPRLLGIPFPRWFRGPRK